MRRLLYLLAGVACWKLSHRLVRQAIGAFRCERCKRPFTGYADAHLMDGGDRVAPTRRTFGRGREAGITRDGWTH